MEMLAISSSCSIEVVSASSCEVENKNDRVEKILTYFLTDCQSDKIINDKKYKQLEEQINIYLNK